MQRVGILYVNRQQAVKEPQNRSADLASFLSQPVANLLHMTLIRKVNYLLVDSRPAKHLGRVNQRQPVEVFGLHLCCN